MLLRSNGVVVMGAPGPLVTGTWISLAFPNGVGDGKRSEPDGKGKIRMKDWNGVVALLSMMGGKDGGQEDPHEAFPLVGNARQPGWGRSGTIRGGVG